MRLQDLNWMDVERYLETDDRILLITGATEQHSYLSLFTDILIPSRLALAVVEREPVLVAPSLNFGVSGYFAEYPGTISLTQATFARVLEEIVDSLHQQGFRRFFVLNGHGGNQCPPSLLEQQAAGTLHLVWYDWWRELAVKKFEAEHHLKLNHANWGENFPFVRVAVVPRGDKPLVSMDGVQAGESMRHHLGDGSFGGPYQVDDSLTTLLFNRVVDEIVAKLQEMKRQD